jgi:hypothetical protein
MSTKRYTVTCHWDKEAEVWYVAETDVPGLATEARCTSACAVFRSAHPFVLCLGLSE